MAVETVNNPLAALGAGAAANAAKQKAEAGVDADRFLKMLVAQLKNQDPLNPLDNAQVTTQMAQISTVEGINKLNATIGAMATGFNAGQTLQAANMVGRQVLASGNTLTLPETGPAQAGYLLPSAADGLTLTVKSASGVVVHTAQLGAQPAGLHVFQWDGMSDSGAAAAKGAYTFEVAAKSGKESISAETLALGRVDGVTPAADGTKLSVSGLGDVSMTAIKHIF